MKYSGSVLFAIFNFVSGILSVLVCKLLNYIHSRLIAIRRTVAHSKKGKQVNQIKFNVQNHRQ